MTQKIENFFIFNGDVNITFVIMVYVAITVITLTFFIKIIIPAVLKIYEHLSPISIKDFWVGYSAFQNRRSKDNSISFDVKNRTLHDIEIHEVRLILYMKDYLPQNNDGKMKPKECVFTWSCKNEISKAKQSHRIITPMIKDHSFGAFEKCCKIELYIDTSLKKKTINIDMKWLPSIRKMKEIDIKG